MSEPLSKYMLIFTIGPVQTFISQARKTRDLWAGSLLLSKLMEVAMRDMPKEAFVFPSEQTVADIPDIPNKYIAIFEGKTLKKVQEIADESSKRIEEYWGELQKQIFVKVIPDSLQKDGDLLKIWKRQTSFEHLFEVYYAILLYDRGNAYGIDLEETEGLLAARKHLRNFLPQEEPGEKSSMSGEREVLTSSNHRFPRTFWQEIAQQRDISSKDINKDGDECLDAIDTIKRFLYRYKMQEDKGGYYPFRQPFPSTSSIAVASFVESLLEKINDEVLEKWYKQVNDPIIEQDTSGTNTIPYLKRKVAKLDRKALGRQILSLDGDLYFPEMYTTRRLEKDYGFTPKDNPVSFGNRAQKALKGLLDATDSAQITRPTPYYATVQMDGDNMGILMSHVTSDEQHRTISEALSHFARHTAKEIAEEKYPGKLVYAGGDDVLAFAPLARDVTEEGEPAHILTLVNELQTRYVEEVKKVAPQGFQEKATASIGIAIAHHYTSLSYVLRAAREAENKAKKQYERNALVVTLIRRSGEQTRVGCHWNYKGLDDDGQPIPLFSRFHTMFKKDVLSPKCIYILLEEAPALVGLEPIAQASEIKRVLLRQLDERKINTLSDFKSDDKNENYIYEQAKHLTRLAAAMDGEQLNRELQHVSNGSSAETENLVRSKASSLVLELHADEGQRYGLVETMGWLLVMAFLARKDQE